MERFSASAVTHLLVVSDAQASRDWYTRVLDAEVDAEYGGTSVVLDLFDNWLLLVTGGEPTADKPTVTFTTPTDPDKVSTELIFRVDDCRATYELLRSRGAEFLAEPVDWGGEIRAFFRDPDGHLFEISELVTPETRRRRDLLSQDPGPFLDRAGGPPGEELLDIYDPDARDEDDDDNVGYSDE